MQPHWPYHVHVQNDMNVTIRGLNLLSVWEQLEPGHMDVVSLEPGESIEFKCTDPNPHLFQKRFKQAVTDVGGTPDGVWFGFMGSLSVEE